MGIPLTGCIVFQQKAQGAFCVLVPLFCRFRRFRPFPPWFCAGRENPQKKPWKRSVFKALWRRRWDSNPRALADYLISSQARYDHFDTSPQYNYSVLGTDNMISSQSRYDHFDTAPCKSMQFLCLKNMISSQPRYDHFDTATWICSFLRKSRILYQ